MIAGSRKGRHVLVVEDNPGDLLIITEVLLDHDLVDTVEVARDGQEALDVLKRMEAENRPPDLITLDLNLPYLGGLDLLGHIRRSPVLGLVPVVVLSTSDAPRDVTAAYQERANSYVVKGTTMAGFSGAIADLGRYWLQVVHLAPPLVGPTPTTPQ